MTTKLTPVVGYPGGKRRMLSHLRPFFDPTAIRLYAEPFVGMGAVYLDLRARGFTGPAILSDINKVVCEFWQAVHHAEEGPALIDAAEDLKAWPATEDGFWKMMAEPAEQKTDRVARFLWLTNYMYANLPPSYIDGKWKAARSSGTKLKSAAKWNKTFPWGPCVDRLRAVVRQLAGMPCEVHGDGLPVLRAMLGHETIYADPPYLSRAKYEGNGRATVSDFINPVLAAKGNIVLSEMEDIAHPPGWTKREIKLLSRQAGPFNGAGSHRSERIYCNFDIR